MCEMTSISTVTIVLALQLLYPSHCQSRHQLLVVLPLEITERPTTSWERGWEILPGGLVAIENIKRDPNILPENDLGLTAIDSKMCGVFNSDILSDFVNYTKYQDVNVVGMTGLFCSSSEMVLSELAIGDNLTILSISTSVSQDYRQFLNSPYYYRALQSADIIVEAFSRLVRRFKWTRVAVVTESSDRYFFSVAEAVYGNLASNNAYNITPFIQVHYSDDIPHVFSELERFKSNIILLSVNIPTALEILCTAKHKGLSWPNYAWMVHSITFSDFVAAENYTWCNILEALEKVIILEQRLSAENNTSSSAFSYFQREYSEKLHEMNNKMNTQLAPNPYANILHDAIWVYALALHSQTQANYTRQLPDYVKNIKFNGTTGKICFNSSSEIRSGVDIVQVKDGSRILVGYYNSVLSLTEMFVSSPIPSFEQLIVTDKASLAYTLVISLALLILVIAVTLIFISYVYYRKEPEIKSTSFTLSLLMFLGCYAMCFYLLLAIVYTQSLVPSSSPFNICTAIIWFSISGIPLPLILAIALVKMLRVYRIFTYYRKIGKLCSDVALLVYVILLITPCTLVLLLWSAFDPYTATTVVTEHPSFTEIEQRCSSKYILSWFGILIVNIVALIIAMIIVAVKTRKIRQAHFKDTKKVNAFLFVLLIIVLMTFSYWMIFRLIGAKKGYSDITLHISHIVIVASCQGFLFVPKVLPPFLRKHFKGYEHFGLLQSFRSLTQTTVITK